MITLSEQAIYKIKDMMKDEEGPTYLRIGVTAGGCSGFSYGMGFDEEKTDKDESFVQEGIPILIDKASLDLIRGLQIDYKESMMGGGFTIHNPNATATCGCGSSFRTATQAGKPGDC
ncbi:iron-sulfur cluster assembly accessory protein [Mechercharimyces sp. CAU 1602]|uniref:HesB/IscA family protein n=1 Tax=Mechercharimyces sp. CAU 1602 TaxID=2973933 RepID=UPI002162F3EA|nr:iron-sulfur cluster assembly accessory protein [Mechercharimyces sp. CAU 1602]MCS1351765.1 iron-sulfur cluster assembly accessory protein [Mechercharimyces sp. CAU 1602]